jgi:hypothetical protein
MAARLERMDLGVKDPEDRAAADRERAVGPTYPRPPMDQAVRQRNVTIDISGGAPKRRRGAWSRSTPMPRLT